MKIDYYNDYSGVAHGTCNGLPGSGGKGGHGGHSGRIEIIELDSDSCIKKSAEQGEEGEDGSRGLDGYRPQEIHLRYIEKEHEFQFKFFWGYVPNFTHDL